MVTAKGKTLNVLLVEDSEDDAIILGHHLAGAGYLLTGRRVDALDAFDAALGEPFDLVISDFHLDGEKTGGDLLALLSEKNPRVRRILCTGSSRAECRYAELTLSAATALNPHVGYDKASEIVKEAASSGRSLREVARDAGVPEDVLDQALDYRAMAKPHD